MISRIIYVIGVFFRGWFIYIQNPPTRNIYSDMERHIGLARKVLGPGSNEISDTISAPGGGYVFGMLMYIDPTLQFATFFQFIVSCLIPIAIYKIALKMFNQRVANVSLAMASLYFPYVSYAGYFLTENIFCFLILGIFYLYLELFDIQNKTSLILQSVLLGLFIGITSGIKSIILLIWACVTFLHTKIGLKSISIGAGVVLVLSLFTLRCSLLSKGKLCLISREVAISVITGRVGSYGKFIFYDEATHQHHFFAYPVALQGDKPKPEKIYPFEAYETEKIWKEFFKFFKEQPAVVFKSSIGMVYDLFWGNYPWPHSSHPHAILLKIFMLTLYDLFILLPALLFTFFFRQMIPTKRENLILLWCPLIGTVLTALIAAGEPRYRMPSDGFLMILSACFWVSMAELTRFRIQVKSLA